MSIYNIAKRIVLRLHEAGHTSYFAGGWVRDHLLNLPCSDIDIATSASPEQVIALFDKTVPVGIEFGSVVVVEEGLPFEVTTFREEGPYFDGRRPSSVRPSDAEHDAQRRGLTINGMFWDPLKEQVLDYVGGQADLEAGIIRAVGDPLERFEEDKLRMVRTLRFAARFGFTIEPQTAAAIRAKAHELPVVSVERLWQELVKACAAPAFPDFLLSLDAYGLLQHILLPIDNLPAKLQPLRHYPKGAPPSAYIFGITPPDQHLPLCDKLKLSRKDRQLAEQLALLHSLSPTDLVGWVHFRALDNAPLLLEIAAAHGHVFPDQQPHLAPHIQRIRDRKPLVTAKHLIDRGLKPGPELGALLAHAERIAIEQDLHDPNQVLERMNSRLLPRGQSSK